MSINPTLPVLFAQQMGAGARLVNEIATNPEATQAMARHMADAMLKEQSQQVQKLEDPDLSAAIHEKEHNAQDQQQHGQRHNKQSEDPEESGTSPSTEGPFLGNLVNRKV